MFRELEVEREVVGECNGTPTHAFILNNQRAVVTAPLLGTWAVTDAATRRAIVDRGLTDTLGDDPQLVASLHHAPVVERQFTAINPWTIKVADHCNMGCTYCYEDAQPSSKRMSMATAAKVIDEILATRQDGYVVLFHGGEPTLNMPVIRFMVADLRARVPVGTELRFIIHTNLLRFDRALRDELRELGVQVGTSLDGPAELNDAQRVDLRGNGTYERVTQNLRLLDDPYVITTVTAQNVDRLLDVARDLVEGQGVLGFHFLPLLPHGRADALAHAPDSKRLLAAMCDVFDYIAKQWERGIEIQCRNLFDPIIALHVSSFTSACHQCALGGSTAQSITINWDGTFGPCDATAGNPEYLLGNILECNGDLDRALASPRNFRMFKRLEAIIPCRSCSWRAHCAGGCEEESLRPGYEAPLYCEYYYGLHARIAALLPELTDLGITAAALGRDRRGHREIPA